MENWNENLIQAAREGNIEAINLCLQNNADIDYQDVNGLTAFMVAVREGNVKVTQLLLESGCKKDITTEDGSTALHLAAEQGNLQVIKYLVEQGGISPFVKTHTGETPYDLAATELDPALNESNTEVMEYLQSVMSNDAQYIRHKTFEKKQETPQIEDEVPTEIKLMADKRSVPLYLKLLESGSEKKRDIRLVIVGKKGAGKTSLLRRLFSEENTDVVSTNGIEIHKIKCIAMSDNGIWKRIDGMTYNL